MFNAIAVQSLPAGKHLTIPKHRGLRLRANERMYNWIYRYKNPDDGRIRQVKLGEWPNMSLNSAVRQWRQLKSLRDQGIDPSTVHRQAQAPRRNSISMSPESAAQLTVQQIGFYYYEGHVKHHWGERGAKEVCVFSRARWVNSPTFQPRRSTQTWLRTFFVASWIGPPKALSRDANWVLPGTTPLRMDCFLPSASMCGVA
jgi:hypothetical protein